MASQLPFTQVYTFRMRLSGFDISFLYIFTKDFSSITSWSSKSSTYWDGRLGAAAYTPNSVPFSNLCSRIV